MPSVELKNITKRFGRVVALRGISLRIEAGEYVVILGPSGCGKTTLLNVISGVTKPSNGRVFVDNTDVTDLPLEERGLSFVFQNIALFPHMSVWKNVSYSPKVKGLSSESVYHTTETALQQVESLHLKDENPMALPSGFQQKISIARAIASEAKLMILDEPTSALDPQVRNKLQHRLRELVKTLGLTALHVTHDQDIATSIADRIILMKNGSIVRFARPDQMYTSPQYIFEAFFIGQGNFLEGFVQDLSEKSLSVRLRTDVDISVWKDSSFPNLSVGDPVIVFSRPENVIISKTPLKNSVKGRIKDKVFMGPFTRYGVQTETEDSIIVDSLAAETVLAINDEVFVRFKPRSTNIFLEPKNGLYNELKLE
ncbi:MAG TPA: ABC transporter ATP-binding protein [Candidatus Hodarchaeales archaeon]|nr:ABC transporter ATP-binding protein [Candidatus Hodarchaeales archaeon]